MAFQNTAFQVTAWMLAGTVAVPTFAHAQTTTDYSFARNLYYQAKIAPPPRPPDVFPMGWHQPLSKVPPSTRPTRSQAVYAFPPPLVRFSLFDVTSTYLTVQVLHYQDKFEALAVVEADNTVTPDKWLQAWKGPPNYNPAPAGGAPFVPKEAVLENTVTPDKWLQAWRGPPSYRPIPVQSPPFVPKEATLENSLGHIAWHQPFYKAAPRPPVWSTQPFFGYPYAAASNLTTTLEWMQAWQGPPRYQPPRIAAQPFVPREATLENTLGHIAWHQPFYKAVPRPPAWATQPFFGYPYISAPTVTTTLEWLRPWQGPPRYQPVKTYYQPWAPRPPVVNLTTTLEWLQAWKGPPSYRPVKTYYQPWVPRPPVSAPYSLFDVQTSYLAQSSLHYQDLAFGKPPPPVVPNLTTTLEWLQAWKGPPRYTPVHSMPIHPPYPWVGVLADEGPADEHERIACVPLASRVAIVPELSRVVDVPLSDREQDSNEYRDRTCGTPPIEPVAEPEVPTEESPFQEDTFQHEEDAFQ